VLLFATIFFTPYGKSAGSGAQVVQVDGVQFAWVIQPSSVKANEPVEFQLRSRDVSHAFAVYNADHHLLFQVQVVPERTQKYVYTFKEPGSYEVLCFEFCGINHDLMRATLEVTP
jgi:cytochrome c oxidase subunit 2